MLNPLDAQCNRERSDAICVSQLKNAREVDRSILQEKPDVKIFLPFKFYVYRVEELFQPNTYNRFLGNINKSLASFPIAWRSIDSLQLLPPATTSSRSSMKFHTYRHRLHWYHSTMTLIRNSFVMVTTGRPIADQIACAPTRLTFPWTLSLKWCLSMKVSCTLALLDLNVAQKF